MPVVWPGGTYGLVQPSGGCPVDGNSRWYTGWRYHDTEDSGSSNAWSSPYNLAGSVAKNNMKWQFCIKVSNGKYNYQWPPGRYCILKKATCPPKFTPGHIYWDDEDKNNRNDEGGYLPDGSYSTNTRIDFCCRNDGSTADHIILPTNKPFILVATGTLCQNVYGMNVSHQWFKWDDEDDDNNDSGSGPYDDGGSRNHKLHFCYYTKK